MAGSESTTPQDPATRKRRGAWYTPAELIEVLVTRTVDPDWAAVRAATRPLRVIDPACGDGRLLAAVAAHLARSGVACDVIGVDIDAGAIAAARAVLGAEAQLICGDALDPQVLPTAADADLVIANPPFVSQMAAGTSRGGSSRLGGGPYADVAAEFCALALDLADPQGGRIALVIPQSLLTARDAGPIRARMQSASVALWDWHSDRLLFDAAVRVSAIGRELTPATHGAQTAPPQSANWGHLLAVARGIPDPGSLRTHGTVGDRARATMNFRDQYYGLIPAVIDSTPSTDTDHPPFITSGIIDPGVCRWGHQPVRFAKRLFNAPRVDLRALDPTMQHWARGRLVPKVLVASQTRVIEAVADTAGAWIPGVPITSLVPHPSDRIDDTALLELAAVLTNPVTSLLAWWDGAGSGLSARAIRISPRLLAALPWPEGDLHTAVEHLRAGETLACGRAVAAAFGMDPHHLAIRWWEQALCAI